MGGRGRANDVACLSEKITRRERNELVLQRKSERAKDRERETRPRNANKCLLLSVVRSWNLKQISAGLAVALQMPWRTQEVSDKENGAAAIA